MSFVCTTLIFYFFSDGKESLLPSEACLHSPLKVWQLIRFYSRSCVRNRLQVIEPFQCFFFFSFFLKQIFCFNTLPIPPSLCTCCLDLGWLFLCSNNFFTDVFTYAALLASFSSSPAPTCSYFLTLVQIFWFDMLEFSWCWVLGLGVGYLLKYI